MLDSLTRLQTFICYRRNPPLYNTYGRCIVMDADLLWFHLCFYYCDISTSTVYSTSFDSGLAAWEELSLSSSDIRGFKIVIIIHYLHLSVTWNLKKMEFLISFIFTLKPVWPLHPCSQSHLCTTCNSAVLLQNTASALCDHLPDHSEDFSVWIRKPAAKCRLKSVSV